MADVNCYGQLVSQRGGVVPLLNTAQTENAEEETKTDSNFVGSTQTAGLKKHARFYLYRGGGNLLRFSATTQAPVHSNHYLRLKYSMNVLFTMARKYVGYQLNHLD